MLMQPQKCTAVVLRARQRQAGTVQVTLEILELLLTYCRFHRASGRSDKVGILVLTLQHLILSSAY